jgi:hypothetical protein
MPIAVTEFDVALDANAQAGPLPAPISGCQSADLDLHLEFALQIYDHFLERYGENHEQTRIVYNYVRSLESRIEPREVPVI